MTSPRVTRSRAQSQGSQQAGAAAAAAAEAVHLPVAAAAASEAGPSRRKRPLENQLSEDDYSCPICLNLLLDPVVSACGHDCCELCFQRWTVGQGKRSCPVCRAAMAGGPAAPLPGVCLRLQRTLEQLFPERIKERQAEVAEQKRQLAAEKRRREEEQRRAAAAREAANADNDRMMHALLEHLLHEHAIGLGSLVHNAGGRGAQQAQQPAYVQQPQQAQQQVQQQRRQAPAARRGPFTAQIVATEAAEQAGAAGADDLQAQQQPAHQQAAQSGPMGRLMSNLQSLFGGRGRGAAGAGPNRQQQQQQQQPAPGQSPAGQPAAGQPGRPSIEVQVVHLVTRPGRAGTPQMQAQVTHLEIPMDALALPPGHRAAAPAAAAAGSRGASSGGRGTGGGSAAWPEGPPLEDMHFEMGWGEQNRRRRSSRGARNGNGSGSNGSGSGGR